MAEHYAGNPNNVQIGINDTALTLALEKGDFDAAEKFIEENTDASLLDEGPFEKIPLALVLSTDPTFREFPCHLRLAKLLVESGANPNLRIPHAEWQGATASPMEYLVTIFKLVNILLGRNGSDELYTRYRFVDPLFTIGLHDETNLTPSELREQLLELMGVFLAYGGNPNVTTMTANSTLFHVVLSHTELDMDLVMKLCEAGGDMNQSNVHGTTPLMDLITYAEGDAALDILKQIWSRNPDISSLQAQNCANETALWRAMFAGSPELSIELLKRGADPSPRAMNMVGKSKLIPHRGALRLNMQIVITGVSAILAPLLQDSSPYVRLTAAYTGETLQLEAPPPFSVALLNKVFSSAISPVVDHMPLVEVFPETVLEELNTVIYGQTRFAFNSSEILEVAALTFGKLKAGLQQLCVRQILHQVFFTKTPYEAIHLVAELSDRKVAAEKKRGNVEENWDDDKSGSESSTNQDGVDKENQEKIIVVDNMNDVNEWEVIRALNEATVTNLVKQRLQLPSVLIQKFQIETSRLQLGSAVYSFESVDCMVGCDDQSEEGSSQLSDDFDDDDDNAEDDESDWLPDFVSSDEFDITEWGDDDEDEDDDDDEEDEDEDNEAEMDKDNLDADSNCEDNMDDLDVECLSTAETEIMEVDSTSNSPINEPLDDLMMFDDSSTSVGLEWEDIDREQYETLEDLGCDDSST